MPSHFPLGESEIWPLRCFGLKLRRAMGCASSAGGSVTGVRKCAGVKDLRRSYQGSVSVSNGLGEAVKLRFAEANLLGGYLAHVEVAAGEVFHFDPGESWNFDFHFTAGENKLRSHVVRGGCYALKKEEDTWTLETVSRPERQRSRRLADVKGVSFSFSASGWMVIYQLGAAACLQNHGLALNPYARVSGASGGALTACLMMYGADTRRVVDVLLRCAHRLHNQPHEAFLLRNFVLQAMQEVIQDGAYEHPLFQEQRCEIVVSATKSSGPGGFAKMMLTGEEHRLKEFSNSADIAIALLASSTCGISGLPFKFRDEDGIEREVADGAFKNCLPVVDAHSISVKPFCAGIDVFKVTGERADVGPSEYVPMSFCVFPPPRTMLEHLYELGYQDMETWLERHLEERLQSLDSQAAQASPDLPDVSFTCQNDGMLWYKEVLQRVPVKWADMLKSKSWLADNAPKVLHEGMLEISACRHAQNTKAEAAESVAIKRWVSLTEIDFHLTCKDQDGDEETANAEWLSTLPATGELKLLSRSKGGRIHLSWIQDALLDDACNYCSEDTPEKHFVIRTVNYSLVLKASSHSDATAWVAAVKSAVAAVAAVYEPEPAPIETPAVPSLSDKE
ncbi:unnamed protein product [Effrenium voratum]|nr:unnamed protein product [Effrenium voratum]